MPIDSNRGQGPFRYGPTAPSAKDEADRDPFPYNKGAGFPRLDLPRFDGQIRSVDHAA